MAIAMTLHDTNFTVGDTIRVHYRIIEKDVVAGKTKKEKKEETKERIQVFEGMVLAIRGGGDGKNFLVRRIGNGGVGIERIFPAMSPWIRKIEIKRSGDVRRAKAYYLREKTKKEIARIATKAALQAQSAPASVKAQEKKIAEENVKQPVASANEAPQSA